MGILVIAEHDNQTLKPATRNAVTAATKLGSDITVLVAGEGAQAVADAAAKIAGVTKVLLAEAPELAHGLPENLAPLVAELGGSHEYLLATATSMGKSVMPRVAALLDVQQVSEIMSVEGPDTFTRPIYAGNAIATVRSSDAKKVLTVRGTAFPKAAASGGSASVESASGK